MSCLHNTIYDHMLKSRQVKFVSLSEVDTNSACLDGVLFIQLVFSYSVDFC